MGERKVVNKYIPPDFDPKLVPRGSRPKDDLVPVRMMLPFTIQCGNCSSFLYKGTKFNSKKEPMRGADGKYLGIQRFRFVIKCTACLRPLTFLTDPKNADYEMENGGTRTYEVRKDKERTEEEAVVKETAQEKIDPMKALEKRVIASQREMADIDNLEEIKAMNMRNVKLLGIVSSTSSGGVDAVLSIRDKIHEPKHYVDPHDSLCDEDELLIQSIQFGLHKGSGGGGGSNDIHRLDPYDEQLVDAKRKRENEILERQQRDMLSRGSMNTQNVVARPPVKIIKRKKRSLIETDARPTTTDAESQKYINTSQVESNLLGLLGDYESD